MAKEQKNEEKYYVGEVATETQPVIVDREEETQYTITTALAKIMNDIEKLKKLLD